MEFLFKEWQTPWEALRALFVHPLWLGSLLLLAWQYAWKGIREQQIVGVRLDPPTPLFLRTLLVGLGGGIFLSGLAVFYPLRIFPESLLWVWGGTILFTLFRLRWACSAYAVGSLTLITLGLTTWGKLDSWWASLAGFLQPDWLWLVSALHVVEWALVRLDGQSGHTPIRERGKRSRVVGGMLLQKIWVLPLIIPVSGAWLPLPMVTGFARINLSRPLQQQKRRSSSLILVYAAILGILTTSSLYWASMLWFAAAFSVLGHEGLYQFGRFRERRRDHLYVQGEKGLKIWAVWPQSPCGKAGLQPGDTLIKVNGLLVQTVDDVKDAIHLSPAYLRMELMNGNGEPRWIQQPLYEGDPSHLGIIPVPGIHTPSKLVFLSQERQNSLPK